jgi:HEAT repeat protein
MSTRQPQREEPQARVRVRTSGVVQFVRADDDYELHIYRDLEEAVERGDEQLRAGATDSPDVGRCPRVRRTAANAPVEVNDRRAVEPLIERLADSDPLVRSNAALALGEFEAADPRSGAIAEALTRALGDSEPSVRAMAASAIGRAKPAAAVEPLIGLLDDPSQIVRRTAAAVLSGFDDPRARDASAAARAASPAGPHGGKSL